MKIKLIIKLVLPKLINHLQNKQSQINQSKITDK